MKIAISGHSGLVGAGLAHYLEPQGHEILPLVRKSGQPQQGIYWDPAAGFIDRAGLEGVEAVIHLAGENLSGYWTRAKKERILTSRREGTRLLSQALAGLHQPPKVLLSASAVGYYGDADDRELTESSKQGRGFLAEVCSGWESATDSARLAGIRVANSRFGIILDAKGGALAKLLPIMRSGLGGKLGNGKQYWSWIAMNDVYRSMSFILNHSALSGAVNITAPQPVTNAEFTRTLAKVLRRPAFFSVPAWALRLAMGEMAQEMLLNSSRVLPEKLLAAGFRFEQPDLDSALATIFKANQRID
jgi:uncharacterized protein